VHEAVEECGEAGSPVTVVWLPGRRPPAGGLEFVEKLLTGSMVALDSSGR
jgi:hypothetical protein